MAKTHSSYVCQQCGYSQIGWAGKCPSCDSWGSLVESVSVASTSSKKLGAKNAIAVKPSALSAVKAGASSRTITKITEFDRVLGGGLVPGHVILLSGEPGVGKSTLLLQVSEQLGNVIYVCGEESPTQIKIRSERLGISGAHIEVLEETDVDTVIASAEAYHADHTLGALVVDSIQTVSTSDLTGTAGSVGQVRESASRLVHFAKKYHIPVLLVGHITKEGSVAGPSTLAHIVDTVCTFEGDRVLPLRILRSTKNRFGPTDEIGIFQMDEKGLIPVSDLSTLFLEENRKSVPGTALSCIMEGSRPILVEIQSLVVRTNMAFPRRVAQGIDSKRLELLLAVLTRRAGIPLMDMDVFVNVVGGLAVREPACDLAIALSIASAYVDKALPTNLVAVGELGLLGEVRATLMEKKRISYAKRQGYKHIASSENARELTWFIQTLLKGKKTA